MSQSDLKRQRLALFDEPSVPSESVSAPVASDAGRVIVQILPTPVSFGYKSSNRRYVLPLGFEHDYEGPFKVLRLARGEGKYGPPFAFAYPELSTKDDSTRFSAPNFAFTGFSEVALGTSPDAVGCFGLVDHAAMRPLFVVKNDADVKARNGVFDAQTARFPTKPFGKMDLSTEAFVPSFQCVFKTNYFDTASTEASMLKTRLQSDQPVAFLSLGRGQEPPQLTPTSDRKMYDAKYNALVLRLNAPAGVKNTVSVHRVSGGELGASGQSRRGRAPHRRNLRGGLLPAGRVGEDCGGRRRRNQLQRLLGAKVRE